MSRVVVVAIVCSVWTASTPTASGQQPGVDSEHDARPFAVERIRSTLGFLASDELGGRDTPSPGLDRAAEYIKERFEAAGIVGGGLGGSYFHTWNAAVVVQENDGIRVEIPRENEPLILRGGADVRLYTVGREAPEGIVDVARFPLEEAAEKGLFFGRRTRIPVFVEVDTKTPLWRACGGRRVALRGRRSGGAPIFLVRKGVLPARELSARITIPAPQREDVELRNVVGLLRGRELPDEFVMFSAHYDHVGIRIGAGADCIFNGADDDASGTSAVIHLAEAFAAAPPPRRSILFVCFAGEEKGLLGSKALAAAPPWPLARVIADVNIEMLGRPKPDRRFQAWFTGRDLSDLESIMKEGLERAGITCVEFPRHSMLFGASDNFSLARKGVVAHSISAGYLHEDYHQPTDEVDRIDTEHMARVIRGIYEGGRLLAERGERPRWNAKGRRRLGLDEGK